MDHVDKVIQTNRRQHLIHRGHGDSGIFIRRGVVISTLESLNQIQNFQSVNQVGNAYLPNTECLLSKCRHERYVMKLQQSKKHVHYLHVGQLHTKIYWNLNTLVFCCMNQENTNYSLWICTRNLITITITILFQVKIPHCVQLTLHYITLQYKHNNANQAIGIRKVDWIPLRHSRFLNFHKPFIT